MLVRCFCDVLKVPEAGATDDFFADLGGHSLLATRLVSQLRELLQIEIPLRRVFEARCARELSRAIVPDDSARQRLEAAAAIVLQVLEMSDTDVRQQLHQQGDGACV
ncbi:phosphopantetheine-binding protein [Mesorhizobium kowhaii]|uniref:phosphopantetheine-binding protein n=1 Tax=Mesorhizobium kowhaii TaxID=1300272 RepID=UPI003CCB2F6E